MNCGLVEFIVGEWNRQPKKLSAHPDIYPSIVLYQNASRLAFENFLLIKLFPMTILL